MVSLTAPADRSPYLPPRQTPATQAELDLDWRRRAVPRQPLPPLPDDLQRWTARICTAVAEVVAGDRPAQQLFRVMRPGVMEQLQRRARVKPSDNGPIRGVTSLRVASPNRGVIEASAVVRGARRHQAVAVQLRRAGDGRWVVTAAEIR